MSEAGGTNLSGEREQTLRALLAAVELRDVAWLRKSVSRVWAPTDEAMRANDDTSRRDAKKPEFKVHRETQALFQGTDDRLVFRFDTKVEAPDAHYDVDLALLYSRSDPGDVSEQTAQDFAEHVALFTAWPFIRAAVYEMGSSVRAKPVTLGLLRQKAVTLRQAGPHD